MSRQQRAFWAGCRLYLTRHRHGTVHTRHFQRAMEDATGHNLDRFFGQWIHANVFPVINEAIVECTLRRVHLQHFGTVYFELHAI